MVLNINCYSEFHNFSEAIIIIYTSVHYKYIIYLLIITGNINIAYLADFFSSAAHL